MLDDDYYNYAYMKNMDDGMEDPNSYRWDEADRFNGEGAGFLLCN